MLNFMMSTFVIGESNASGKILGHLVSLMSVLYHEVGRKLDVENHHLHNTYNLPFFFFPREWTDLLLTRFKGALVEKLH